MSASNGPWRVARSPACSPISRSPTAAQAALRASACPTSGQRASSSIPTGRCCALGANTFVNTARPDRTASAVRASATWSRRSSGAAAVTATRGMATRSNGIFGVSRAPAEPTRRVPPSLALTSRTSKRICIASGVVRTSIVPWASTASSASPHAENDRTQRKPLQHRLPDRDQGTRLGRRRLGRRAGRRLGLIACPAPAWRNDSERLREGKTKAPVDQSPPAVGHEYPIHHHAEGVPEQGELHARHPRVEQRSAARLSDADAAEVDLERALEDQRRREAQADVTTLELHRPAAIARRVLDQMRQDRSARDQRYAHRDQESHREQRSHPPNGAAQDAGSRSPPPHVPPVHLSICHLRAQPQPRDDVARLSRGGASARSFARARSPQLPETSLTRIANNVG